MRYITRLIEMELKRASRSFSALILTGPRRAGKTTLLRKLFPDAEYYLLEDPDVIARLRTDPRSFLEEVHCPAILDEIQNVPEVLGYIRSRMDRIPGKKGQWFLTGSQEAPLMRGVTESLTGRAALFNLLPLSQQESPKVTILRGGFPEVLAHPSTSAIWFRSYVQTYLERDVRSVSAIRDLATFRRFMSLVVSRCGQILNRTDLAAPLGVSVPTVSEWLNILEITGQVLLIPPFFENFGKRLIKSPKLYFVDSGLVCHLLGIESEKMLNNSPFLGPVFEGFVASEIIKQQIGSGRPRALYYFRDQQGLEVDFIVPSGHQQLLFIEAKASRTVTPAMADPLERLAGASTRYRVAKYLVHRESKEPFPTTALKSGVQALPLSRLPSIFEF
ncbi:MAG: ATP-binding protein [Candidatus Tectomicrobia bacterium]|uniref:ATP-binding protein n=1 Tax=Tectimicrobiota bacterium TaxID=2528274 RepID=A0A933LRF2_UNCTE|nr:ATP-binding protein [Candidatus Tectomicrobia bacterium]